MMYVPQSAAVPSGQAMQQVHQLFSPQSEPSSADSAMQQVHQLRAFGGGNNQLRFREARGANAAAADPRRPSVPEQLAVRCTIADIQSRYQIGDVVGVGGFATVKKALDLATGETVAIKIIEKSRYEVGNQGLEREIQVLSMIDHPNCTKLYAVYYTERNVYIVTELMRGGELLDRISELGNYQEHAAARLISEILDAVCYLHSMGIVHRDLKLENLVLVNESEDSPVKVADFGLSKMLASEGLMRTMCGSPQYVAPEVLNVGEFHLSEYTPAVDMWSVGVILFILLSGYSPFDDDDEAVLFENIRKGMYDVDDPIWEVVSAEAKDLVAKLLVVDASKRLTAREALRHPFVQRSRVQRGLAPFN